MLVVRILLRWEGWSPDWPGDLDSEKGYQNKGSRCDWPGLCLPQGRQALSHSNQRADLEL